jgi:hypothetical protein
MTDRIFRIRSHSVAIAALGVLLPGIGIATILSEPLSPPTSAADRAIAIIGMLLVGAFAIFRMARARLRVLLDGVMIHNYLRNRFIPWNEIGGFSLRPWGIWFTPVGHADLTNGSSVPILGIGRSSPQVWRKRAPADDVIDELNRILVARRTDG